MLYFPTAQIYPDICTSSSNKDFKKNWSLFYNRIHVRRTKIRDTFVLHLLDITCLDSNSLNHGPVFFKSVFSHTYSKCHAYSNILDLSNYLNKIYENVGMFF